MNLSKCTGPEKLQICKAYYYSGYFLLPILWLVNVIWFSREVFKESYPEQRLIRQYILRSFLGALFWIVVLAIWISVFQTQRISWGAAGDALSVTAPRGEP